MPMNSQEKRIALQFRAAWDHQAKSIHETCKKKGFWDTARNDGEVLALMHSEISEGLEALRHGNPPDDHIPDFTGIEAELADLVIRVMDYGHGRGLRLAEAIVTKAAYNRARPRKHGKEF